MPALIRADHVGSLLRPGEQVDPSEYYFRTTPRFRPSKSSYGWLERSIFIGVAERYSDLVIVKVWMML
jgi:hypothetical protein